MKREKKDTEIIILIIVFTFVMVFLMFGATKGMFYSPPSKGTVSSKSSSQAESEDVKGTETDDVSVEEISALPDNVVKAFEEAGRDKACEKLIDVCEREKKNGCHLGNFEDFGGSIDFENNKSAYSWIRGYANIDKSQIKLDKIILVQDVTTKVYMLFEVPYTIDCTKVTDDSMYSDYKKYEGTTIGSGCCYSVVMLDSVHIKGDNINIESATIEESGTKDKAEEFISSITSGVDKVKEFEF